VLEVAPEHRERLVLAAGAANHQPGATRDPAAQRPRVVVGLPGVLEQPGGKQRRQLARVVAVGILAWPPRSP
jgi:hypothetical protein